MKKLNMIIFLLTTLSISAIGLEAQATVCNVPSDHSDITTALSSSCTTILVSAGTYSEDLNITSDVEIIGLGKSGHIIINGSGGSSIVTINSGLTSALKNLTISDGSTGAYQGAGININDSSVTLDNVTIDNNTATYGGGVYCNGSNSELTINNSTISNNTSTSTGGGIHLSDCNIEINNSSITSNISAILSNGGGIYAEGNSTIIVNESVISDNIANGQGGGLYLSTNTSLELNYSNVSNNTSTTISTLSGAGGGICAFEANVDINYSTISNNQSPYSTGGGIAFFSLTIGYYLNINHSTIDNNSAYVNGGGIYLGFGTANIHNSTISTNTANSNGGGIYYETYMSSFSLNISYSTIYNNTSISGDSIYEAGGLSPINVYNSILTKTATNACNVTAGITSLGYNLDNDYSCFPIGGTDVYGDPNLRDLANYGGSTNTHLPHSSSIVVDAGDPTSVENDQRDYPNYNIKDIGATECINLSLGMISTSC